LKAHCLPPYYTSVGTTARQLAKASVKWY